MKFTKEIKKCIVRHMNVLEPCYRCKEREEYNNDIQYRKRCSTYKDSEQWLREQAENIKSKETPKQTLCSCGRIATMTYSSPQGGGSFPVCSDCYDIEQCQDQGYGITGESYSEAECRKILEARGWKSAY